MRRPSCLSKKKKSAEIPTANIRLPSQLFPNRFLRTSCLPNNQLFYLFYFANPKSHLLKRTYPEQSPSIVYKYKYKTKNGSLHCRLCIFLHSTQICYLILFFIQLVFALSQPCSYKSRHDKCGNRNYNAAYRAVSGFNRRVYIVRFRRKRYNQNQYVC